MFITKTLLTEILLEVTNEEILHVAKETHRKATRGLLLSSPFNTPSTLVTQALCLNLERNHHVYDKFYKLHTSVPCNLGRLNSKHGSMSDIYFQPLSANASEGEIAEKCL